MVRVLTAACVAAVACGDGARAIARAWRAGARARDLARRHAGGLRQLRHLGDPLVAGAQRGRAGAALPRRRGQRGRAVSRTAASSPAARTRASRSGRRASRSPTRCSRATTAPVVALAVSPDGATLASASWDHTARLWPLDGGAPRVLEGHTQNVNGVAFTPDGARWSPPAMTPPCASGRSPAAARRSSSRCRRRSTRSRSRPTARSSPPAPTARSISCRRAAS